MRKYREGDRERFLGEVRASGDPVRAVARRMGVSVSTAYLWKKAESTTPAPKFVRVMRERQTVSSVVVQVGAVSIRVEEGFDAELLRSVVAALSGGAR